MNTGLGDAVNLAWKMAAVLQGHGDSRLLDTYESERVAFAKRLVATTDRAFQLVTSTGALAAFVRLRVVPIILPVLFAIDAMRRFMFRTVSQIAIEYRDSALSSGAAGEVRAGDRLPWVKLDEVGGDSAAGDNFAPLAAMDWQLHVYGETSPAITELCRARGLAVHAFAWRHAMQAAGLARNAAYLIRPDGYIGFADAAGDAEILERYVDAWQLRGRFAPH